MCEASVIIAGVAAAVQVGTEIAGGVIEGEAQGHAARAQADEIEFQAQQERRNAELARKQASDVLQIGTVAAGETEAAGRDAAGAARTAVGASGVEDTGSVANLIDTSESNAAIDANRIRVNAAREAWGFKEEARQRDEQAERLMKAREEVLRGGYLSQVGTGLRTAGRTVAIGAEYAKGAAGGA